jgi:methionine-rich copper-binding protein CopC/putative copper export protein/ABC-type branched-subunit amino acid transport system substrate-binding protein
VSARRSPRRGQWLRRGGGVALLTALIGIAGAPSASAHPYLLRSDPAAGAILATAPRQIDIDYTEGLDRSYCNVVLVSPTGARIQTHQVAAAQQAEFAVATDQPLDQQGTYAVEWTAVGDDGHTVIGNFGFSVGHPSANPAVATSTGANSGSAASPGGAQRLLSTALPFATVLFAGVLLLAAVLAAAGRRAARLRRAAFGLQALLVSALTVAVVADGGLSAFTSSATGHRLLVDLGLTALAIPLLLDGGRLAAGERPTVWRRWLGYAVGFGLLLRLAAAGHAATQPASRRDLALAVYTAHLIAVSLWLGALAAVAFLPERRRALRSLAVGSLVAVLASGVATTDWGLRTLHDVPDTLYGKLALTKLALFGLIVVVGAVASWQQFRRGNRRVGRWLVGVEAGVAAVTLIVAGVLGQIAQPLDQPYPSQAFAADTGLPVSVTSSGPDALDVATLAPGIVGHNTLVVEVGESDEQDFLSPAAGVHAVSATLSCGCGAADQKVTLRPTGRGDAWTADVTLPRAASWLVTANVHSRGATSPPVELAARVTNAALPHQVVVGVPASFSGANGETCRDQTLGLQTALADLNRSAADHGELMRVVAVDLHNGAAAALARLRVLGARMIALPCGTTKQVDALTTQARAAGLPVVLGATNSVTTAAGVWSTQPSWQAEGAAIAEQAVHQQSRVVTAVVGKTPVDQAELAGMRAALAAAHVSLRVAAFPARPARYVAGLAAEQADLVAVLGNRSESLPLVQAFSTAFHGHGWVPSHGILASTQLMSTDFINAAGTVTRLGGIEFASNVNPFDPVSQYYAQRLRALTPGVRPSFDGLRGYEAGLAIGRALADGGGDPSPASLTSLLGQRFRDFAVGSYRLGWQAGRGTSTSLAFFRSTYINPMAMPSDAPGGASSLAHEGTFLDVGGFEQVAPFRRLN